MSFSRVSSVFRRGARLPALALLLCFIATESLAQGAWPTRPIRLIHGFLAGGSVDLYARLIAAPMSEVLGQQVVVEGRPGAGGTVGAAQVARSEPDGYTLFLAAGGHASSPSLYRSLPYDAVNDFTYITLVARNPYLVLVHPSFPARSMKQLVEIAKRETGKLDFGTGGVGTGMHLVALLFQHQLGIQMNHIAYRGGQATPTAAAGGEVPIMVGTPGEVRPMLDAGRLVLIGVTSKARWFVRPDVPTLAETVLPGFDISAWYGLLGPAKLPPAILSRLNEAARIAMKRPDVIEKFRATGAEVAPTTPEVARKFVAGEVERWRRVIKQAGIPPQN